MFERYTERARRVIFFARYEASAVGSPEIETEHLLLGLMRENRRMLETFSPSALKEEAVRAKAQARTPARATTSVSIDLPLSNENKRVLAYAAEEASGLRHMHIGSEHLVLGLLREEGSLAAAILREGGLRLEAAREHVRSSAAVDETRPGEELLAEKIARGQTVGRTLATRIDMTPEAMRAMMYAEEEGEKLGQARIGTEHLLLGLLREERSGAGKLLQERGLRVDELREHIARAEPGSS